MRGPSFSVVLDEVLRRLQPEPHVDTPSAWATRPPAYVSAFLFARPLTAARPRPPAVASALPPGPAHALDAAQRRAFERLVALGATLPANFSAEDLRREYRRLAQRYHPDRHDHQRPAEREALAHTFAEVTDLCRCLRVLVDRRH